jgi:hypothetical protein
MSVQPLGWICVAVLRQNVLEAHEDGSKLSNLVITAHDTSAIPYVFTFTVCVNNLRRRVIRRALRTAPGAAVKRGVVDAVRRTHVWFCRRTKACVTMPLCATVGKATSPAVGTHYALCGGGGGG